MVRRRAWRRPVFLFGLALLAGATILLAIGTTPYVLAVARCIQGASGGIVPTAGLALLVDAVARDEIGGWMGFVYTGLMAGVMVSPLLGGIIYARAGYFAVFAVTLGIIAVPFLMCLLYIAPEHMSDRNKTSAMAKDYGIIINSHHHGYELLDASPGISSVEEGSNEQGPPINNATHLQLDKSHEQQSILLRYFPAAIKLLSSPRILTDIYGAFIEVTIVTSFDAVLPLFAQSMFDWDSTGSGAIFLALTLPSLSGSLTGIFSDRIGTRIVVLAGFALTTVPIALMSLVVDRSIQQIVLLCALLVLTGHSPHCPGHPYFYWIFSLTVASG